MPGTQPPAVYRRRRVVVTAVSVLVLAVLVAVAARWRSGEDGDGVVSPPPTAAIAKATTTTRRGATTSTTRPTGRFDRASGGTPVVGSGTLYRYAVEVEEGTGVDVDDFARAVDATLDDRRGWTTADGISLQRVSDATAQFTVRLATPATTDLLCAPLTTEGQVSCGHNDSAVINLTRWLDGAAPSKLSVADYRHYVVTHEFGHLIGHRHETCPGPGRRATTMMQQSYDIGACTPNPWPAPDA